MTQRASSEAIKAESDNPLLVCMLPARNAEADLPGYLENVSAFCDAVVALDDGSTDGTCDILAAHPLVRIVLRNPPREGFQEWNDATNRNRLLEATEALDPQWLIALDADERVDERDAASLREFLQTDALPGFVYGFRHVPMCEDGVHFLPRYLWYYRLFAAMPGQRLPSHKLHFVPVPTTIPRERWIKTTLRIQHLGELAPARRLARFGKYLEADPEQAYEMDYSRILADVPDASLRRWRPRPASMPVLLSSAGDLTGGEFDLAPDMEPVMSVIVLAPGVETNDVDRAVANVVSQEAQEPFEVILVVERGSAVAQRVGEAFPSVTMVEVRPGALPGEARNAGLDIARGKIVVFQGPDTLLLPGNLAARIEAHRRGFAMVTGTVHNETKTPVGWAAYLLEHDDSLPGLPALELERAPTRCSYGRLPLFEVGDFRDVHGVDVEEEANRALTGRTYYTARAPEAEQMRRMARGSVPHYLWDRFERGRAKGRLLVDRHRSTGRLLTWKLVRDLTLEAVPLRLMEIEANALAAGGEPRAAYQRYRGLVALGLLATLGGTWFEVLRPEPGKLEILAGRPVVTALVSWRFGRERELRLVRVVQRSGNVIANPVGQGSDTALWGSLADGPRRERGTSRVPATSTMGLAIEAGQLEYISVDTPDAVPLRDRTRRVPASGVAGAIVTTITVARALSRGRIRSTMSTLQTARVLLRIRRMEGQ